MNPKAKSGPFVAIVAFSLLASLVGCASVEKRYKKGQELEEKGRLEEAAQRYISVLAKEPGREDARERLADVGARVIDESLAQARAAGAEGLYENAVAAIIRVDGLRDRSGQVGVDLAVPDDYADFRRDMIAAATEALFRQGEDLENAGDWAEASRRYDKLRSYPLTSDQAFKVDESRARVLLRWAERDMELGSFRAAYTRAQGALDIFGADSETGTKVRAIQAAALNAGTRTVAVLPFWVDPGAGAATPRGIENDLYDSLLYERMAAPPLFVGPVDRGAVHREMSRLRVRSGEIPVPTALLVGRSLNADFVVIGWLESYEQEDGTPQEIAKKAPLRRDRSTSASYTEKRYTARLTGEVTYRLFETATGRMVEEETFGTHATAAFRRAYFDGDYATLDLSREERALFNKEEWLRAEEELRAGLVDKLAERIASGVFERALRHVR